MDDPAEAFFRAHARRAYNLALRLCGNPADAEDISQEALLRALRSLSEFRGEADPGSWVHRITVNVWKNRLRAEKSRPLWRAAPLEPPSEDGDSETSLPEPGPGVQQRLESAETEAQVQGALLELKDDDRAVVILKDLEGLSYVEIAVNDARRGASLRKTPSKPMRAGRKPPSPPRRGSDLEFFKALP